MPDNALLAVQSLNNKQELYLFSQRKVKLIPREDWTPPGLHLLASGWDGQGKVVRSRVSTVVWDREMNQNELYNIAEQKNYKDSLLYLLPY